MKLSRVVIRVFLFITACLFQQAEARLPALKDVYADFFLMGGAIGSKDLEHRRDVLEQVVLRHYNSITPENCLKWEKVHPEPGRFDFEQPDNFVSYGQENGMHIVGHVLVWHQQTPDWVYQSPSGEPVDKEYLKSLLVDHIERVVGRYRGRIHGWDVINEAVDGNGDLRKSFWLDILGEEYLEIAFLTAHEADPEAELYYNDYNLTQTQKRKGVVRMLRKLLDDGVPVHGVGMQGHWGMDYPSIRDLRDSIEAYADLGLKVMITEMDVSVLPSASRFQGADISAIADYREELDPFTAGLPDEVARLQAERYAQLFDVFTDYADSVTRVTFWGITDGDSWKNNFPVRGRTDYPLLFDRQSKPKPAFFSIVDQAGKQQD